MILVGELALWVALLMAAWCATVSIAGGKLGRADLIASGERAAYATVALVILASAGLWTAILTHDFSLKYVASFTSANLPTVYLIASFWGGQSGSLLFWTLLLAVFTAMTVFGNRARNRALMPYVTGTLGVLLLFFLATLCFASSPYERLDWVPAEGRGMNPQLQSPGMAIHPPNLYFGFVATHVPFAFVIAALITRQLDSEWLAAVRRWALLSWLFLTIGIVLGMWWAYVELGWGGYWAWDPVENSSLLPWLTQTAFLHSVMIHEKRGMLRKWNVTLVAATFLLAILGTFITRSGVISSVHAFATSDIGSWFLIFLILGIAVTAYLVTTRLRDLEARAHLESMVSNRRRYGGYIMHAGIVLMFAAFAGMAFRGVHGDVRLGPGETFAATDPWGRDWTFTNQGVSEFAVLNRRVTGIALATTMDGKPQGIISSEKRQHVDSRGNATFEPSTEVGIHSSAKQDVYVVLAGVVGDNTASLSIAFNPLVVWAWVGGALIAIGGLIVMWPQADRRCAQSGYIVRLRPEHASLAAT